MNLSLCLIHNKTNLGNRQQITNLLPLITKHIEPILDPDTGLPLFDPQSGDPLQYYWYSLTSLTVEHNVKFYQIIPFNTNIPNNLYDLDSYKVFYGANNSDKTGEHPRFFNWLLKRGTDNGADIVIYIRFPTLFGVVDLDTRLGLIRDDVEFVETPWGKIGTVRLLREVGQLREDTNFDEAINDFKTRILARGLRYG